MQNCSRDGVVLAMLKVDCKSLRGMRLADGRGNTRGRRRYGVEEGDSGGAGPVAVAGAGCCGWGVAGLVVYGRTSRRDEIRHTIPRLRAGGFCIKRGVCCDCAKIASGDSRGCGVWRHDLFTDDFLDGSLDEISYENRPYAPCAFVFGDIFRYPGGKTAEDKCRTR
jgi:hypothetical protein